MGITRQSVQRSADLLVAGGLAEYRHNPAHRTAKLVTPTEAGRAAVARISPSHARFARLLADELTMGGLAAVADGLRRLTDALDRLEGETGGPAPS
jgi:DNA-binding MarR family transcriptional regulator